jgi:hypothetical protein
VKSASRTLNDNIDAGTRLSGDAVETGEWMNDRDEREWTEEKRGWRRVEDEEEKKMSGRRGWQFIFLQVDAGNARKDVPSTLW